MATRARKARGAAIQGTRKNGLSASPGKRDPYCHLAAAILKHAARAAMRGDLGAALWLQSEQAAFYSRALELDYNTVKTRAAEWAQSPAGTIRIKLFVECEA